MKVGDSSKVIDGLIDIITDFEVKVENCES